MDGPLRGKKHEHSTGGARLAVLGAGAALSLSGHGLKCASVD